MARSAWGLGAILLVVAAASEARPAEGVDGNWKFTLLQEKGQPTVWLLKLTTTDGKLAAEVAAKSDQVPETTIDEVSLKADVLHLTLKIKARQNEQKLVFEGKINPKEAKKILGSLQIGPQTALAALEQTALTSLDPYELGKEKIVTATGPEVFDLTLGLLSQASDKKAKPDEVRAWAARAAKIAETYGPTWHREYLLRTVEVLTKTGGDELAKEALPYARQAERLLVPGDRATVQKRVLGALSTALTKAGKEEEAKEVEARISKLDALLVVPAKFAGRKAASDRIVLVELFTGAECGPCATADLIFDGLGKTYKPKDVVFLQYHLHVGGPDPLVNGDCEKRQRYYSDELEDNQPNAFINGKAVGPTGGRSDEAQEKYDALLGFINPLLEGESKTKLKLNATQKGDKIEITAEVSELATPGEKVRLRLVLIEEQVKYKGGNKVGQFQNVVRAFPGGTAGLPLTEKTGKQTATVNLEELRTKLKEYLTEFDKESPFPNKERPLDLKKLRVVAFVQNDTTREILQAAQVELAPEKAE